MIRKYTPAVRFANSGSAAGESFRFKNSVENTLQHPTSRASALDHFSGVIRKTRDFGRFLVSSLFNPTITYANPNIIATDVITTVSLTGSNFTSGSDIYVRGVLVNSTFINSNYYRVVVPADPEDEGDAPIQLIRRDQKTTVKTGILTYEDRPNLTATLPLINLSPEPHMWYVQGGEAIQGYGSKIKDGSNVLFVSGAVTLSSPEVTWRSPFQIDATTPAVPESGSYFVRALSPSGLQSENSASIVFEYRRPVLTSISPNTSSMTENKPVTLTGQYFTSGALIRFGDSVTVPSVFINSQSLSAVTPTGVLSGADYVFVINKDGKVSATGTMFYRIEGLQEIHSITPPTGILNTAGGTLIEGLDMLGAASGTDVTSIAFGTSTFSGFEILTDAALVVQMTASVLTASTQYDVHLSSSRGVATLPKGYYCVDVPTITSISPTYSFATGGTIRVTGTNFSPDFATIKFIKNPADYYPAAVNYDNRLLMFERDGSSFTGTIAMATYSTSGSLATAVAAAMNAVDNVPLLSITTANNKLYVDGSVATNPTQSIPVGVYTFSSLAAAIQDALRAVGASNWPEASVSADSTGKLLLYVEEDWTPISGTNSIWSIVGFTNLPREDNLGHWADTVPNWNVNYTCTIVTGSVVISLPDTPVSQFSLGFSGSGYSTYSPRYLLGFGNVNTPLASSATASQYAEFPVTSVTWNGTTNVLFYVPPMSGALQGRNVFGGTTGSVHLQIDNNCSPPPIDAPWEFARVTHSGVFNVLPY
jgi:hypothetical protein